MRAMRLHALRTPLRLDAVALPEPGAGEVRLAVRACGINFADTLMVEGGYQERPPLPFSPGMEVCGTVEALGEGVASPGLGARVACFCGSGGLAEAVCVPSARCVTVPDAMPDEQAAGLLVAYGTSHVALAERAKLRPGETLLVLGASGGVGLTAVKLGKLMGARVIAVAHGVAKRAVTEAAGADHSIDAEEDVRAAVKALGGADVLYDPVGGALFDGAVRACNPGARILPLGFASGTVPQIPANVLLVKNLTVIGFYWGGFAASHPEIVARSTATLLGWYAQNRLHPSVSHVLPLSDANAALDLLRDRKASGKVVVRVGSGGYSAAS